MFDWFKKKSVDHEAHKKIDRLNNSVSHSFKNLKRDMNQINSWLNNFNDSHADHSSRLQTIENQLSAIIKKLEHHDQSITSHAASIESMNFPSYEYEEEVHEEPEESLDIPRSIDKVDAKSLVSGLTDTQKLMFIRLLSLQRERGGWVPLKSLAEELYPGKDYSDVRSTISEYLTLLSEWGVVTKKRTGKQSFVSVTEKGEEVIEYLKSESKKSKLTIKKRN